MFFETRVIKLKRILIPQDEFKFIFINRIMFDNLVYKSSYFFSFPEEALGETPKF